MSFLQRSSKLFFVLFFLFVLGCTSTQSPQNITSPINESLQPLNETQPLERLCSPKACGCHFFCSYDQPTGCQPCTGEEGLAQVCIVEDGQCKNAEDIDMTKCSLSGGQWKSCGSGCGPIKKGESLFDSRTCPAVCVPQCSCPFSKPYWEDECVEDSSKGPQILIQKRVEDGSTKYSFRALVHNYDSFKQNMYCARVEWDFNDGTVDSFTPVCGNYTEHSSVQDEFQMTHTFKDRGHYKVTFTLINGAFDISTDTQVDV